MQIERQIPNFDNLFHEYQNIYRELKNYLLEHEQIDDIQKINKVRNEFDYCNIKLRMAFAINRIDLNHRFMQEKLGTLRLCHLMFYKFADIWFAYESFFNLYELINQNKIQSKIVWLNQKKYSNYKDIAPLGEALSRANEQLNNYFNTNEKRKSLIEYLRYCKNESFKSQKKRIEKTISKLTIYDNIPKLQESELLTIGYAVRNNFVHNGETTISTPKLNYSNKKDLLVILYEYIVILNLVITKNLFQNFCNHFESHDERSIYVS